MKFRHYKTDAPWQYISCKMDRMCWMILLGGTIVSLTQLAYANILDVSCINFNPIYDPDSTASFAAILNGADITSELSFQRSVDLNSGVRSSSWCSQGEDDLTECGLPQESTIDSTGKVTFEDTASDKFGVYGCRAERYSWTTKSSTIFIRDDAHFNPEYFTVTVSIDEEVQLVMNVGSTAGTGVMVWRLNHESGGQTDLTSDVYGNELYISKANKDTHAGIHHYYYANQPDQGGLVRLIVRACLDNYWGPDCQYTCPTCYNGGVCDDVTGRCICPPGFSGDHCGRACSGGMFGQDCSGSCSTLESSRTDCSGAVFCLPDPYGCSCAAGWTGLSCDQGCPTGKYGAGCTQTCHCESSGSCNSATGACSNGCEDGWTGDQCQVTIVDIIAMLRGAGVDDTTSHFLGLFMIGDSSVTGDSSLKYYIGREVDTGPGETGHGASLQIDPNGDVMTTDWTDTGLPPDTTFDKFTTSTQNSYRSFIHAGGDARVGAYRMSIDYKGFTERNILLNQYRGDTDSEVWPEKLSTTVGVGETITLVVFTKTSVDTASLRWRHNGGSEIIEWNGMTSVTINDVRKSDDGIYECHVSNNRVTGKHAILRLIVRGCPSTKYGFDCSQDCPVCYAGGVCHDVTGECVCRAGFMGDQCQTPCSNNNYGRTCDVVCSSSNPGCGDRLFSPPDPVGMACINGFTGNRCQTECDGTIKFGADCELDCNCEGGTCSDENACSSDQCTSEYEGPYCQALRSDLPCPAGYFGTLCNYPCHCDGDVDCERTTGYCPNDVDCAEGWAGLDCQQALPRLLDFPIVSDVTNDSVLIVWNAWTDGYDYGNGPVHSYQIDYSWTDDTGIEGSEEPVNITGDSTAFITGLFGFRDYEFYLSVRREVEGQIFADVRSGPLMANTLCGAPLLAPDIQSTTVDGSDSITVRWVNPQPPSSSWLQCDSSVFSYNLSFWPVDDPADSTTIPVKGSEESIEQTIDGLDACTEYLFTVVVINSDDLAGPADQTTATTDTKHSAIILQCSATSMSVRVPLDRLGGATAGTDLQLMNDGNCQGEISDDGMAIVINTNLTSCSNNRSEDSNFEYYSNTVVEREYGIVTRVSDVYIPFTCYYNRTRRVGLRSYELKNYRLNVTEESGGQYDFAFDIYRDENFEEKYTENNYPIDMEINEDLYFGASVPSQDETLDLSIIRCVATPSHSYNDDQYVFIDNGCPADQNTVIHPDNLDFVGVTMITFRFVSQGNRVYIHCDLLICDATTGNLTECDVTCSSGIDGRQRRDVTGSKSSLARTRISRGPIRFRRSSVDEQQKEWVSYDDKALAINPWTCVIVVMGAIMIVLLFIVVVVVKKMTSVIRSQNARKDDEASMPLIRE